MDLALFDFDGTITDAPTYGEFVRFAVPRPRQLIAAVVLAPAIACYRLGLVSDARARAVITWAAFACADARRVRELGRRFARERLRSFLRPHALERLRWHIDRGDRVIVVSASLACYLEPWAEEAGVEVICSRLQVRGGRLTGRYEGSDCCGEEKAARLRHILDAERYGEIYAYGDTDEDRDMLRLASRRFFRWREVNDPPASSRITRRGDYRRRDRKK